MGVTLVCHECLAVDNVLTVSLIMPMSKVGVRFLANQPLLLFSINIMCTKELVKCIHFVPHFLYKSLNYLVKYYYYLFMYVHIIIAVNHHQHKL